MTYSCLRLLALCGVFVLIGCGGPDLGEGVEEESYAELKVMVDDFANMYANNQSRAREEFDGLSETIAGYAENPMSEEHQATLEELQSIANQLSEKFDNPDAVAKLKETAEKLPGDAEAFRKQMRRDRN